MTVKRPARARVITDIRELEKLARFPGALIDPSPVTLNLPGIAPTDAGDWQTTINRHLSDCGCVQGMLSGFAFLAAYGTFLALRPSAHSLTGWVRVGVGLAVLGIGGLLGKVAGLIRAKILLDTTIRRLKSKISLNFNSMQIQSERGDYL